MYIKNFNNNRDLYNQIVANSEDFECEVSTPISAGVAEDGTEILHFTVSCEFEDNIYALTDYSVKKEYPQSVKAENEFFEDEE